MTALTTDQIEAMAHAATTPEWGDWWSDDDALLRYTSAIESATRAPLLAEIGRLTAERDALDGRAVFAENDAAAMRALVERLTAQADACSDRYWALVREVAEGRALQPAPAIVVTQGPNTEAEPTRPAERTR